MKMRKITLFLSIILALVLVICACGGSQDTNGEANTETETNKETNTETETNTNTAVGCEHEWKEIEPINGSCTEDSVSGYTICEKCGEYLLVPITTPAMGHTEEYIDAVKPTCTETGTTRWAKCSVCDEVLIKPQPIPPAGHIDEIIRGFAATCTEPGLSEGARCRICKEITRVQEPIAATGHNDVNGTCSVCKAVLWEPAPDDEELNIITESGSDFIIVYEAYNDDLMTLASLLSSHIRSKYGVYIPCYDYFNKPSATHEIVLGSANANLKHVKDKIASANDFIIDICGDDLFLYAPNKYLYDYMLEIAKIEIFDGKDTTLTLPSNTTFIYQESEYKNLNYAQYYKAKNGSYSYNSLLNIFKGVIYEGSDSTVIPYRIYVPSSYDPDKEYPLVTILHGAGERGNDNSSQLKNMISEMFNQESSPYLDAIIICPQCPSGQQWVDTPWEEGNYSTASVEISNELSTVLEIILSTQADLSVDTDRLYVMGLSMGGFGTWDLIMRNPNMFAAAVPLCGGADVSQASALTTVPIWAVHGTDDTDVPYAGTAAMCAAIKEAGGEICIFDSKEGFRHNVWGYVGASVEISSWLFEQSK